MTILQDPTNDLKKVKYVQFGTLSPEEIRSYSVVEVVTNMTYENGRPKSGGLLDLHMGPIEKHQRCTTDGADLNTCPGYFGHLELAKPMYHVGYLKTVQKVLRCVCKHCSRLLLDVSDPRFASAREIQNPILRLRQFAVICNTIKTCGARAPKTAADEEFGAPAAPTGPVEGCGNAQWGVEVKDLSLVKVSRGSAAEQKGEEKKSYLPASEVLAIFKNISDSSCRILGLDPVHSRPEWMILTVVPVPPPSVRPSIMAGSKGRADDDLTYKYANIIQVNRAVREQERSRQPAHIMVQHYKTLQYHIATLFDNELINAPRDTHRSGRPLKTVRQRLRGKEGRIRGNLMGKRVDFSARTVITADPNLCIDQVGVPRSIALNLTFPETVTPFNMRLLAELVRNGPRKFPGAKYILRTDGQRIDLRYARRDADLFLDIGYIVERHLRDDDCVLFNRQPTLHKMSMMGHRVKVLPYSTFRLNLSVTTPYNADFDGDEMNLHVPQSLTAKSELVELMMVPKNIISTKSSGPVMGLVQDALLGSMRITRRDVFLGRDLMFNCLLHIDEWNWSIPQPAIIKPKPLWTGKQLFSHILPKINLEKGSAASFNPADDSRVLIENGELLSGICTKDHLGAKSGSVVHVSFNQLGWREAQRFLDRVQKVVNHWLLHTGFTVGISDMVIDSDSKRNIEKLLIEAHAAVRETERKFFSPNSKVESEPGMTLMETFEKQVNIILNKAGNSAGGEAQKALKESNNLKAMVVAGSKGSLINISQIMACVGQVNVEGKRIRFGFRDRTLPHFVKHEYGPDSRGFVKNSYIHGLTPHEFFFHAMGGREGIIDTAVKTALTGYIQRRLIKAMEDVQVKYDGTVRDSTGMVLQFLYGEDGMDGAKVEPAQFDTAAFSVPGVLDYEIVGGTMLSTFGEGYLLPEVIESFRAEPRKLLVLLDEKQRLERDLLTLQRLIPDKNTAARVYMPVNLKRLMHTVKKNHALFRVKISDLDPVDVINRVKELCKTLVVVPGTDSLGREAQKNATLLFQILLRTTLASKQVIKEHRFTAAAFAELIGEIETRFFFSLATPGEMVGALAAQSIGEPATQMTLNTFHFAGVSSKNVTLGVPRLQEIMNLAKRLKTPSVSAVLKAAYRVDEEAAKSVQSQLEYCTLRSVTARTQIWYDPDPAKTLVVEDRDFVDSWFRFVEAGNEFFSSSSSPWLMRIVLDRAMMLDKRLTMAEVAAAIEDRFKGDVKCIYSDDTDPQLVIHMRIISDMEKDLAETEQEDSSTTIDFLREMEADLLSGLHLRGIRGLSKIFMRKEELPDGRVEWYLDTDGTNLPAVLAAKRIDRRLTVSNDVLEVFATLGIEAARGCLLRELRKVLEFDGSTVGYRHLAILCDIMTARGHLMAITRHGINRSDAGPLMRCSFEESVEILVQSAAFGERDLLKGVSGNIMLGQLAPVGTGAFELYMDEDMLAQAYENAAVGFGAGMEDALAYDPLLAMMTDAGNPYASGAVGGVGAAGGMTPGQTPRREYSGVETPGVYTPSVYMSGFHSGAGGGAMTPSGMFSPTVGAAGGGATPGRMSAVGGYMSPYVGAASPAYSPTSGGAVLGAGGMGGHTPASPLMGVTPASPAYVPGSSYYNPSGGALSAQSPGYSPTTGVSPASPSYSPTVGAASYAGTGVSSYAQQQQQQQQHVSPSSPQMYSPASPMYNATTTASALGYQQQQQHVSPSSPQMYSPASPSYQQ